jgi:hypothetical protein
VRQGEKSLSAVEEIRSRALQLPREDRATLAHDLLLSLEPDEFDRDAESAWAAEIAARSAAVARGEFTAYDSQESLARMRAMVTQRRSS